MNPVFSPDLAQRIEENGVIAVLVIDRVSDAIPLAEALLQGGIRVMELTFRTDAALDALREIKKKVPGMLAGAGTILSPSQVREALAAGADFGVSPGVNPRVLAAAREAGLSFAPGIATPSDIELALEQDCRLFKFFPAEPSGGLAYLKAIAAPYAHLGVRFLPLGGLHAGNAAAYLADPHISALGGSWLAPRSLIDAGDWKKITALAAEAAQLVKTARSQ
jgi:2-dehydro-3-deoxyphosphogluconate aldolase/(4S)-4-hydroxy-2-oxoglutarate aldolase